MSIKIVHRKKGLNEMVTMVCEWYGMDVEELKTVGTFVMNWLEGDYIGALFIFKEWEKKYYKDNDAGGGEKR